MRCLAVAVLCAGLAPAVEAGTIFADDYGVGAPDVLGGASQFDIRSVEVNDFAPGDLRITLRLNYNGGDASLAAFTAPGASFGAVGLADVLIEGRSLRWAIAMSTGGAGGAYLTGGGAGGPISTAEPLTRFVFPGSLYRVSGFHSAQQVLGADAADDFRADYPVWGAIANPTPETFGSFSASALGGDEIQISFVIPIGPAFYDDVRDGFALHFAGTSCACDVLDAVYRPVPEPGAALLALGTALALLARARPAPR